MSQKWVAVPWEIFSQSSRNTAPQETQQVGGIIPPLPAEVILTNISKKNRKEAATILNHIEKAHNLSWNKKGELTMEETVIPHTHINDLLKDAFYNYKHWKPEGVDIFYKELAKSDLPSGLIRNLKRRALLESYKQNKPPGVLASTWLSWK